MTVAAACASVLAIGCVSQGKYDQAVHDASTVRAELSKEQARLNDERSARASMEATLEKEQASLQKELDDATAVDEELQKELKRLGQNAQSLLAANGSLKGSLDSSQRRLEELRRAQAAAEARAALYADLARRLRSMIDAGDLAISLRNGRLVLRLSNDVLLDFGKAELKPAGKHALGELAEVLRTIGGRAFPLSGHTDNEPIKRSAFRSNWELSTARALEVTGFLVAQGIDPRVLSAAGYGEFDPVDTNDSTAGKAHNRRTEISLQPNIDEIVAVPEP